MSKPDITADEQKEANEIAARLSACVADILTSDFAEDLKVAQVASEAASRLRRLVMDIGGRRLAEQQQQELDEQARRERERQQAESPPPGARAAESLFERMMREERARRSPRSGPTMHFNSGEPLHFDGFTFNFNSGPSVKANATKRTPHDEWRYALKNIAGDAWREGMSDAALVKAAQTKAHPDRARDDGKLFKKVTDLGQRLGVVDDQGRVKG